MRHILPLLTLTLAGCVGSQTTYIRDGIPQAQADFDSAECTQFAMSQVETRFPPGMSTTNIVLLGSLKQVELGSQYGACMLNRGYRVRDAAAPTAPPAAPRSFVAENRIRPPGFACLQEEAHGRGFDVPAFGAWFRQQAAEYQRAAQAACEQGSVSDMNAIFAGQ